MVLNLFIVDVLHSYMGVAILSMLKEPGIQQIEPALNVPLSAYKHLKENTVFWKDQQQKKKINIYDFYMYDYLEMEKEPLKDNVLLGCGGWRCLN